MNKEINLDIFKNNSDDKEIKNYLNQIKNYTEEEIENNIQVENYTEEENLQSINNEIIKYFKSDMHKNIKLNTQIINNFDILLSRVCFIYKDNNIIIDYRYFNYFIKIAGYNYIFEYFYKLINKILEKNELFFIHVNIENLKKRFLIN